MAGQPVMTVTTRIGWDPASREIRSWVFDSEGGFSQGAWARDGDAWIARMTGVTGEGRLCSSTNILTRLSDHSFGWESVNRVVGGEPAPDLAWSVSARKPPMPQ
jgi:hypothetical protein